MPRSRRTDPPGGWHHVMNRGLARRVASPDRLHIRYFLACIARAVRRGEIEAHVVCVLTTHVYLLVRSTRGLLSEALRRVFSSYVRFYNRIRSPAHPQDPLDDLVGAAPARVRDWMERQARLADGHGARAPLVPPNVVTRVLLEARRQWGAWTSRAAHGPDCDLWPAVTAGLLRHLAGLTRVHVAQLLNVGPTRAGLLLERHRGQMTSTAYAERATALAGRCLRALVPGARSAAAPRAPGPAELPAGADSRPVSTGV